MKCNEFMILYVLVCGILMGAVMHGTFSRQKYKTDARRKAPIESVCDSGFYGFEWRGHKYLKYGGSTSPSVLHDPDCPCKTNKTEVNHGHR